MRRITWAAALALGLITAPALAADDQGFYAGAGAGLFGVEVSEFETGLDFDADDTGFRLFGGWQFNEYFGVEAGYGDGGTASETIGDLATFGIEADVDIDVSGFDILLTGTLPFSDTFYGYAKAGMFFWDADIAATLREDDGLGGVIVTQDSASESGDDLAYGVGLGMDFSENFGVRLEYMIYDVSDADADFLSANVLMRF
jgi:OOP family OmpA-OmpF porin